MFSLLHFIFSRFKFSIICCIISQNLPKDKIGQDKASYQKSVCGGKSAYEERFSKSDVGSYQRPFGRGTTVLVQQRKKVEREGKKQRGYFGVPD
jgi:hypothetical protein